MNMFLFKLEMYLHVRVHVMIMITSVSAMFQVICPFGHLSVEEMYPCRQDACSHSVHHVRHTVQTTFQYIQCTSYMYIRTCTCSIEILYCKIYIFKSMIHMYIVQVYTEVFYCCV